MTVKEYNPLDEIKFHTDININEEQNTLPSSRKSINVEEAGGGIRKSLFNPLPIITDQTRIKNGH